MQKTNTVSFIIVKWKDFINKKSAKCMCVFILVEPCLPVVSAAALQGDVCIFCGTFLYSSSPNSSSVRLDGNCHGDSSFPLQDSATTVFYR